MDEVTASPKVHYPALVRRAAYRYSEYLQGLLNGSLQVAEVAKALLATTAEASLRRTEFDPKNIPFSARQLGALAPVEVALFCNQFALGLGSDAAEVIVMGTEAAFDLEHQRPNFVLESCASPVVWFTEGQPAVVGRLADRSEWVKVGRPFHLHPNDYYGIQKGRGTHTWMVLSQLLGPSPQRLREVTPDLGNKVYQIELSASPSKTNKGGTAPSPERLSFLHEVLRTLRSTARTLVFHGGGEKLLPLRTELARTFLRLPNPGADISWMQQKDEDGGRTILRMDHNGKTVLVTRALNANISAAYIARVRKELATSGTGQPEVAQVTAPEPAKRISYPSIADRHLVAAVDVLVDAMMTGLGPAGGWLTLEFEGVRTASSEPIRFQAQYWNPRNSPFLDTLAWRSTPHGVSSGSDASAVYCGWSRSDGKWVDPEMHEGWLGRTGQLALVSSISHRSLDVCRLELRSIRWDFPKGGPTKFEAPTLSDATPVWWKRLSPHEWSNHEGGGPWAIYRALREVLPVVGIESAEIALDTAMLGSAEVFCRKLYRIDPTGLVGVGKTSGPDASIGELVWVAPRHSQSGLGAQLNEAFHLEECGIPIASEGIHPVLILPRLVRKTAPSGLKEFFEKVLEL